MRLDAAIDYSIQRSTTKDLKPLKPKHIQNITMATAQRDVQMSDLFKCLGGRMREPSSIIALKSMLLIHIMIREGSHERVLGYLVSNPGLIDVYQLKDKHDQLRNVREYWAFIEERITAYKSVKEDFVKGKTAMITYYKQEPLDEQKLKSIQSLHKLLEAGIRCDCFVEDWQADNPVQIQTFRLIVGDMIGLFHLLNEAVLRLLAGFFELEKSLAKLGLEIYKGFVDLSKKTAKFFEKAGRVSAEIGVRIPSFKQAPASLVNTLSDHINAPNFEEQRVIASEQRAMKAIQKKKLKKGKSKGDLMKSGSNTSLNSIQNDSAAAPVKEKASQDNDLRKKIALKADPILVDFFSSIDDEVQAFEADTNQAQYTDVGGLWYPQQFGNQDPSPPGSTYGLAENGKTLNQIQIQKQLEKTEQIFASAGFSLGQPGSGHPAPLSNQSSLNGIPNNMYPETGNVISNPFNPQNSSYSYPSAQNAQQTQSFPSGSNFSQLQFGVPAPQSFSTNSYMNPFAPNNAVSQKSVAPSSTAFNPFGAAPTSSGQSTNFQPFNPSGQSSNFQAFNPSGQSSNLQAFNLSGQSSNLQAFNLSGQSSNFQSFENNYSKPVPFTGQVGPQATSNASLPRANTTQPAVQPTQQPGLFGDLASLDLSYSSKPAQNPKPTDPFGMNFGNSAQSHQAFAPENSKSSSRGTTAVPYGGMPMASDPFNPFSAAQQVRNPQVPPGNMNASNPFGNLDFGGQSRTASNPSGNYIVTSSSNAQPQSFFEPRSAPGTAASDVFSRTQQNQQNSYAQDPFAKPIKNNPGNTFGFQ